MMEILLGRFDQTTDAEMSSQGESKTKKGPSKPRPTKRKMKDATESVEPEKAKKKSQPRQKKKKTNMERKEDNSDTDSEIDTTKYKDLQIDAKKSAVSELLKMRKSSDHLSSNNNNANATVNNSVPSAVESDPPVEVVSNTPSTVNNRVSSAVDSNLPIIVTNNTPSIVNDHDPSAVDSNLPVTITNTPSTVNNHDPSAVDSNLPVTITNTPSIVNNHDPSAVDSNLPVIFTTTPSTVNNRDPSAVDSNLPVTVTNTPSTVNNRDPSAVEPYEAHKLVKPLPVQLFTNKNYTSSPKSRPALSPLSYNYDQSTYHTNLDSSFSTPNKGRYMYSSENIYDLNSPYSKYCHSNKQSTSTYINNAYNTIYSDVQHAPVNESRSEYQFQDYQPNGAMEYHHTNKTADQMTYQQGNHNEIMEMKRRISELEKEVFSSQSEKRKKKSSMEDSSTDVKKEDQVFGKTTNEWDSLVKPNTLTDAVKILLKELFTTDELVNSSVMGTKNKKAENKMGLDEAKRAFIEMLLGTHFGVSKIDIRQKIRDRLKLYRRSFS